MKLLKFVTIMFYKDVCGQSNALQEVEVWPVRAAARRQG